MKRILLLFLFFASVHTLSFAQVGKNCDCGKVGLTNRWGEIKFKVGDDPANVYACGYQFSLKAGQRVEFLYGSYKCRSFSTSPKKKCPVNYSALLYRNDEIVQRYQPEFVWAGKTIEFVEPGSYKLVIEASCDQSKCDQCIYYFTVN